MTDDARAILDEIQARLDSRDPELLNAFFQDDSVLIGSAGDGRNPERRRGYLDAVATGEPFRWEWQEIAPFHESGDLLGFAAFGELVMGDERYPMRATVLAARTPDGWRLRHFHGSIPATF